MFSQNSGLCVPEGRAGGGFSPWEAAQAPAVLGRDVTTLPPDRRNIGLVFQNYALYPHMTVFENIAFPLGNKRGAQKMSKAQTVR